MKIGAFGKIKIGVAVLLVFGLLFLHFYVPRIITEIRNPLIESIRGVSKKSDAQTFNYSAEVGREIRFASFDDVELVASETYAKSDTVIGTIILLHGIRSRKEHFITLSNRLAKEGFNVIALDSRGHGQSGGDNCSFGVFEKKDVSSLLDVLIKRGQNHKIGIFGQSLGGAIALQSLGSDERLDFGVVESTFSEFRTITHDYIKYHLGISIKLFSNYLVNRAGSMANFDPDKASPISYCKNIKQPVLMVHGSEDRRISIEYGKANFEVLQNRNSDFVEIIGANHTNVWELGGEEYARKVISFMKAMSK